jgi:hypothetical protein
MQHTAKMRSYCVHFDRLGSYHAHARRLIAVDAAEPGTQITFAQVRIRQGSFPCGICRRQQLIARYVVVEQIWRRKVEASSQACAPDVASGTRAGSGLQGGSQSREEGHTGKLEAVIEQVRCQRVGLDPECDAVLAMCAMLQR